MQVGNDGWYRLRETTSKVVVLLQASRYCGESCACCLLVRASIFRDSRCATCLSSLRRSVCTGISHVCYFLAPLTVQVSSARCSFIIATRRGVRVRLDVQEPQRHRLQCGPLHIKFGASPERQAASALPTASAPGMRARGGQKRSACFGFGEADDEEAARSAAEQRYLKVCVSHPPLM